MHESVRNKNIDYIKIICIILVIITHYNFTDSQRLDYLFPFWIKMGVPVFMIASGYTLSSSFEKHKIRDLNEAYESKMIIQRIIRFLVPYLIFFAFEALYILLANNNISHRNLFFSFFSGGFGQGGYYTPLLIQLIFLFPLVYFLIKKKKKRGLLILFLINFGYEFLKISYLMNNDFYRLIVLRYILLIGFGVYLYFYKKDIKIRDCIISFLIGLTYIIVVDYTHYSPIIFTYWTDTSMLAGLYSMPLVYLFMNIKFSKKASKIVDIISRSTYNIFLVQILYYYIIDDNNFIFTNSIILNIIINIVICVVIGILFYELDRKITNKLIKLINKIKWL